MEKKRYFVLDTMRGFALFNMVLYHAIWDLVYLLGFDWPWYSSGEAYLWQQSICWSFLLISGFCYPLGRRKLKRGVLIFLLGALISLVTGMLMPENSIKFGILTLLGSCMLLLYLLEPLLKGSNPLGGLLCSLLCFFLTRSLAQGFLGLGSWRLLSLPEHWYRNLATAYLGLPPADFYSTDYFPLFPWFFLFGSGYFMQGLFRKRGWLRYLEPHLCRPLEWLGQHSLEIYMLHQPVLYCLVLLYKMV